MKSRMQGFTLLEVLLALVLLGFLLTLVTSAMLLCQRNLMASDLTMQRLDEVRAAQNFLRRALQQTLPLQYPDQHARVVFQGEAQWLRFAAVLPSPLGGGIRWHKVEVVGQGAARALRVSFETPARTPWGDPQSLLRDIRSVQLSYQGVDAAGKRTGWLDRWPWPQRLPGQVRIQAAAGGSVPWTTQIIALRLDLGGTPEAP